MNENTRGPRNRRLIALTFASGCAVGSIASVVTEGAGLVESRVPALSLALQVLTAGSGAVFYLRRDRLADWEFAAAVPAGFVILSAGIYAGGIPSNPIGVLAIGVAMYTSYVFVPSLAWRLIAFGLVTYWLAVVATGNVSESAYLAAMVSVAAIVVALITAKMQTELAHTAETDALTGCLNRRGLHSAWPRELARAVRQGDQIALLALDIDRFKAINDTYGHEVGDRVLAAVGSELLGQTRTEDLCARFGGEEFVVAMIDARANQAWTVAERIRMAVAAATVAPGLQVTVSIGVAVAAATVADFEELYSRADAALYAAKEAGRNRTMTSDAPSAASPVGALALS